MLSEDELKDAVLLVLANKQDMGVMSVSEVVEKLGLHTLRGRDWNIQGTCALTGDGLSEAFTWLSKATSKKKWYILISCQIYTYFHFSIVIRNL